MSARRTDEELLNKAPFNRDGTATTTRSPANAALRTILDRMRLPNSLKQRLERDSYGGTYYSRLESSESVTAREANSSGSECACCTVSKILVAQGTVGRVETDGEYAWLAPGYHAYSTCCTDLKFHKAVHMNSHNNAERNGPLGFVTITEGNIGILTVSGEYRLLAPGTYEWSSPAVNFEGVKDISNTGIVKFGPYTLVSVPAGFVAVTFDNGKLRVLGDWESESSASVEQDEQQAVATSNALPVARGAYFLDDPCWTFSSYLCLRTRTDTLEGNNLLSKDNVELLMTAMSHWRIVNPVLAITRCGQDMETIAEKVNALIRATIARIVAGTNIGAGSANAGGVTATRIVTATAIEDTTKSTPVVAKDTNSNKDPSLAYLMQSDQAIKHMSELTANAMTLGVEVAGVYVPEKRMKNDDVRRQIASQAVIGIKADADRSAADAKSYATVQASRADAEATVTAARAQAEAVALLAKANQEAGELLGVPTSTAARLALTAATASAMEGAKLTVFNGGSMDKLPFMFTEKME